MGRHSKGVMYHEVSIPESEETSSAINPSELGRDRHWREAELAT